MKKNTRLLLLSTLTLSEGPQENKWRDYLFYYELFSDLSEGGVRSILFDLVKRGYVKRFSVNGKSFFELTSAGISKLTLLYPGLKQTSRKKGDGEGQLIIFVSPPEHDLHFQSLRLKLKQHFFVSFAKGVYYTSSVTLPSELFELLLNKYSASVILISVKTFSLMGPDQFTNPIVSKNKMKNSLSEISRRLDRLIGVVEADKNTFYQLKSSIPTSFKTLSTLLSDERQALQEDKILQESFSQAFTSWNRAVTLAYFSHIFSKPKEN